MDAAARNFRRTPPANTSTMQLRPNTSAQRRAQPLSSSYFSDILTDNNSPEREKSQNTRMRHVKKALRKNANIRNKTGLLLALFVWGKFFIAHTVQYSTVNRQQLPTFERGADFVFKYQVVTSESESQVRLSSPFPSLPDVSIDGVHAIFLESNRKLSHMQCRVEQAGLTI